MSGPADWFIRMNNTGGPVDLWEVHGIDDDDLVEAMGGYYYVPRIIPPAHIRLVRTDIVSDEPL